MVIFPEEHGYIFKMKIVAYLSYSACRTYFARTHKRNPPLCLGLTANLITQKGQAPTGTRNPCMGTRVCITSTVLEQSAKWIWAKLNTAVFAHAERGPHFQVWARSAWHDQKKFDTCVWDGRGVVGGSPNFCELGDHAEVLNNITTPSGSFSYGMKTERKKKTDWYQK